MTDDAPVGVLEEQVLVAVLRAGEHAYGMNVRREIEEATGRDVAIGAVYPTTGRPVVAGLTLFTSPPAFHYPPLLLHTSPKPPSMAGSRASICATDKIIWSTGSTDGGVAKSQIHG